jgi:beta-glucosidase
VAADHYRRYAEDVALMSRLGLTSYRFSISWPRVQPTGTGKANPRGLDFYKRLVDALRGKGIAPMATLFHWDLPQALQDRQEGWEARDTAYRFAEYASLVYAALGDVVPTFLTINEPKTVVNAGYIFGVHAPGFRSRARAGAAAHHLNLAHGLAVQALRTSGKPAKIGPALNLHPTYPAVETDAARANARLRDGLENRFWLDAVFKGAYPEDTLALIDQSSPMRSKIMPGDMKIISTPVDVLAVQYYNPIYVGENGLDGDIRRHRTSAASWHQIYPEGFYDILTRVRDDYGDIPIVVTENGVAFDDTLRPDGTVEDPERVAFLREHLAAAHRAITAGVKLIGYHAWSLLDNFEWAEGYAQRWGLVYVDYPTQRRIPKSSALWYSATIRANALAG